MKWTRFVVVALSLVAIIASVTAEDRIFPTDINVKDFGAKGDGVTDDTEAIQAAADAAAGCAAKLRCSVGGRNCKRDSQGDGPMPRIIFPAGTYCLSAPVFFCRDHQVYGLGGVTIKAMSDDIDLFVFHGTLRHFVTGFTMEGGARQFLVETYNNESANFTARDCNFRNAKVTAVDSHSWWLKKSERNPNGCKVGSYRKNAATGKWEKDPRMDWPERQGYYHSTLFTLERCNFEDCQVATHIGPDGAVFREIKVNTSVSTDCVFRVGNNLHAYNMDVTVKRPAGADKLVFIRYGSSHGFLLEHSRFRSADGKGIALVRTEVPKAAYVSNTLFLRALEVDCGGCPEGGIVVCPNKKSVEFISLTDVKDTTGRKVKAVVFPDGISEEDYNKFRYFDYANELTYSIVLGRNSRNIDESLPQIPHKFFLPGEELTPKPVPPLKVPRIRMGSEILWGPDYGVGMEGDGDDTEGMRRLFAAASAKTNCTVVLPPRHITLNGMVEVKGAFNVTAAGVAMIETKDDELTFFKVADGSLVSFSHLFFKRGGSHISCRAEQGATVVVDCCMSFDAKNASFEMNTTGEPKALRLLVNGGVHYSPLWYSGNAQAIFSGAWWRTLPPKLYSEGFTEACSFVNRGKLRIQDILGVPCIFAEIPMDGYDKIIKYGDYRWIDNRGGELHSLFTRFGGEWGGVPPVYTYDGGKVLIEGSYSYFYPRHGAHMPIVSDGKPADLQIYGMACGFEIQWWYGGLNLLRRKADGTLEPIPNAKVQGNVPAVR